ncbi:hypothetical protein [Thaumasiovibrio subtropicus]|uniref:hypothetical protein n=1 Tax=Thaumasiovibrio subtropicus TaxID=1891207 RepID=UPI000B3580DC|nr:hypothetical protein [Thaumasiovibrio subtropicus]
MKRMTLAITLALTALTVKAGEKECQSEMYHNYVDASLEWYQDLVSVAVEQDESLTDVAEWFLNGRRTHFLFNRTAVDWYLSNEPEKLQLALSVESWLTLDQAEIRALSESQHALSDDAKAMYELRQAKPHKQNYQLRSAFADLLSHPDKIDGPLKSYNEKMTQLAEMNCQQ